MRLGIVGSLVGCKYTTKHVFDVTVGCVGVKVRIGYEGEYSVIDFINL